MSLGAGFPTSNVLDLFGGERVYGHSQRPEFQTGDFFIDFFRQQMHARFQLALLLHKVLNLKGLIGKTHIHDAGRMSFRGGKVNQATFTEYDYAPAVGLNLELFDEGAHVHWRF